MTRDFRYLSEETNRHGKPVFYVRINGRRKRIREARGTPQFAIAYGEAVNELQTVRDRPPAAPPAAHPAPPKTWPRGTLGWLGVKYFGSDEFQALELKSQATRRGVIEACFDEPHTETDREPIGFCPLAYFSPIKVQRLRDLKHGLPGAANNRKKYLSAMFGWAIEQKPPLWTRANPARDVKRIKYATRGFHTWTLDEIAQFERRHPIGTKARLALALLLFVGFRRGDFVRLGPQHIKGGVLRFVPRKTRYLRLDVVEKPILPVLQAIIDKSPTNHLTFLPTEYGQPFSDKGFGNWFRDQCDQADLHHCTAHGLRKAGATIAAENGATVHQLMALFDWTTPAQAKVYTEAADRRRLTRDVIPLLELGYNADKDCRTELQHLESGTVAPEKNQEVK